MAGCRKHRQMPIKAAHMSNPAAASFASKKPQYFITIGLLFSPPGSRPPMDAIGAPSAFQQVTRQEQQICGAFRQAPHKIWIPRIAVRNVKPQTVTGFQELA